MYDEMFDDDGVLLDEVTGRKRKPIMSELNRSRRLTKHELDEIFCVL